MTSSPITIDRSKCMECGACVKDCISAVLELKDGKPEPTRPELCNACSHCVAVCPTGAIQNRRLHGDPPRPLDKKKIDPACYKEIVLQRRSVRQYKADPVSREDILDLIEVARYSPTASNTMDVGYLVVEGKDQVDGIGREVFQAGEQLLALTRKPYGGIVKFLVNRAMGGRGLDLYLGRLEIYREWVKGGRNPITHNAPALILVHGPVKGRFARENCAIAGANIANYAAAKGLGTCYLGLLVAYMDRKKSLALRLGLPGNRRVYTALTLGHPAAVYRNTPVRPAAGVAYFQP